MKSFEVPIRTQLRHVLLGMTADGSKNHSLWPLPKLVPSQHRRVIAVAYWHLLRAGDYLHAREDVRTYALWAIAAHMARLDHMGNTEATVDRDIALLAAIITVDLDFARTSSFAMRLMPEFMTRVSLKERAKTRAPVLARLNASRLMPRPNDKQPSAVITEPGYTVVRYRNPGNFSNNPHLAPTWEAQVNALTRGEDVSHRYWDELAQEDRMVFALFTGGVCAATFESHEGHLEHLMVYEPAGDSVFQALADALPRLAATHGNTFKIEGGATPAILRLHAIKERRIKELSDAMKKAEAAWNAEPSKILRAARTFPIAVAQKWFGYAIIAFCFSFFIPALIVMAPMFGRTYVHVWKVALGIEPDCMYPATNYTIGSIDCRSTDAPTKKGDQLAPTERGNQ